MFMAFVFFKPALKQMILDEIKQFNGMNPKKSNFS